MTPASPRDVALTAQELQVHAREVTEARSALAQALRRRKIALRKHYENWFLLLQEKMRDRDITWCTGCLEVTHRSRAKYMVIPSPSIQLHRLCQACRNRNPEALPADFVDGIIWYERHGKKLVFEDGFRLLPGMPTEMRNGLALRCNMPPLCELRDDEVIVTTFENPLAFAGD